LPGKLVELMTHVKPHAILVRERENNHIYFNNDTEAFAVKNAKRLSDMLSELPI